MNYNKLHIALFALILTFKFSIGQTVYTIPGATLQPQWVFPLWFEDADGNKDTVYICYDSSADSEPNHDYLFGETVIDADTNKFNMDFGGGNFCYPTDTLCKIQKVQVSGVDGDELFEYFDLRSTRMVKLPFKIKFDASVLNSNKLPFVLANGQHKAQVQALFNDTYSFFPNKPFCPTSYYLSFSDSSVTVNCNAKDSILWDWNYPYGYANVTIRIQKWNGNVNGVGIDEINADKEVIVNSSESNINITFGNTEKRCLKIYNMNGSLVLEKVLLEKTTEINSSNLSDGMYFMQFIADNTFSTKKIIIN